MASEQTLLGDIGGTTARFAVLTGDTLGPIDHLPVSHYRSMIDAVEGYLGSGADRSRIGAAVLGVAGPVEGGRCVLVNSQWVIDAAELRAAAGFKSISVINDFEAIAYALPHLSGRDVKPVAPGRPLPGESMAVLGPGTGLGMAGVVRREGRTTVIPTEGGHTTLPGTTAREDAVIAWLREKFGHVSAERALSGPGLENLHAAIAAIDGIVVSSRTAAEITRQALDRSCPVSVAAVDMFCGMLGTVAGDLALMFRARGGVYIAGGIAPRIVDLLARSEFHARFVAKGRFQQYLEGVPIAVIVNPDAAFLGLKSLAREQSRYE
ncbi:MAG TPA: glucokinase [Xanthobacteraceae bacterium]|nr:glucokinase [Xanthobacteraceae bacterium]